MKKTCLINLLLLFVSLTMFTSCAVIGGIFKTGVGVGAILVIIVIALIVYLITRARKK